MIEDAVMFRQRLAFLFLNGERLSVLSMTRNMHCNVSLTVCFLKFLYHTPGMLNSRKRYVFTCNDEPELNGNITILKSL